MACSFFARRWLDDFILSSNSFSAAASCSGNIIKANWQGYSVARGNV